MLLELSIKDFAIIEGLTVSFGPGLSIFTGETGAGKSIIMDAIALILGDRASTDIIREASQEAQVEALFKIPEARGIEELLRDAGIECQDNGDLIVKRTVQRAGRNRIYINGSLATLVTLTEVGSRLIDVYGQSEHQSLTRPDEHIDLLDAFGGLLDERAGMASSYKEYSSAKKELDRALQDSSDTGKKRDYLSFQFKELKDAALRPGEEEELKKEFERLKNSGRLKAASAGAEAALYSGGGSAVEQIGASIKSLKDASQFDERLKKPVEALEAGLSHIEDASGFLRGYSESIEDDPAALDAAGERLDLLHRLKKKHSCTIEELITKRDGLEKELESLEGLDDRLKFLEGRAKAAFDSAAKGAAGLGARRKKAARALKEKIEGELALLGMKGAVFEAAVDPDSVADGTPKINEKGADRVSFFISANPGEGIKPLAKVASGGELSRIMLALKSAMAEGRVPTLIFDEIDTGVGGAVAQAVGSKLKEVSKKHQVLCITHLPQIAAFADRHFSVRKKTSGGRTVTTVAELCAEERAGELSTMLGGMNVTDTTRKHAAELIETAKTLSAAAPPKPAAPRRAR